MRSTPFVGCMSAARTAGTRLVSRLRRGTFVFALHSVGETGRQAGAEGATCSESLRPTDRGRLTDAGERIPAERRASMTWAQRLTRVFSSDIETCQACGGAVRIIACIEDPVVIEHILTHLDAKRLCAAIRHSPTRQKIPLRCRLCNEQPHQPIG